MTSPTGTTHRRRAAAMATTAGALRAFALRRFVALAGIAALACYAGIYASRPELAPIRSDGYSYYVYLPSWFLHHDTTLESVARDCCGSAYPGFTGIVRWPGTGRWVNLHPIGEAVLMAPFFAAAHALTRWSNFPPDGFSFYYQYAAGLSGLVYLLVGLSLLRRLLRPHYSEGVTLATLAVLTWGTNLFHYGTYDPVFSHAYSFCLVCALMVLTERWWDAPSWSTSILLGSVAGLIVVVRHPNALFLLLVPLYGVATPRDLLSRTRVLLLERWAMLGVIAAVGALCLVPQLVLYRLATGAWVASPYGPSGFAHWSSPQIAQVLIGVRKGLFFWSPALLLALGGFFAPGGWARRWRPAVLAILVVQALVVASWHDWQFGDSFGHRGFTDALGLFAPFLASFFGWSTRRRRLMFAVSVAGLVLVSLSVFQMWQYWVGIVPPSNTTWEQYKALFLRTR